MVKNLKAIAGINGVDLRMAFLKLDETTLEAARLKLSFGECFELPEVEQICLSQLVREAWVGVAKNVIDAEIDLVAEMHGIPVLVFALTANCFNENDMFGVLPESWRHMASHEFGAVVDIFGNPCVVLDSIDRQQVTVAPLRYVKPDTIDNSRPAA